jgi:hypothetical protein
LVLQRQPTELEKGVRFLVAGESCALYLADMDDSPNPPMVSKADWGYIRLRRKAYSDELLTDWIQRLKSQA